MELTLRQYGITVKVLREQVGRSKSRVVRQLYRRYYSEPHRDHHKECLEASGSRYVSPLK